MTLLSYLISIPLGIRKAMTRRLALRPVDQRRSSSSATRIPGFLFAVLLVVLFAGGSFWQIFPLHGLVVGELGRACPGGTRSPTISGTWRCRSRHGARRLRHADAADQELVPRRDPQAICAHRADEGPDATQVLYGHVFRNAMLIIIAGFPGAFIGAFFSGSLLIEMIFSLDGLGLLGFESVDQPRLSGGLRQPVHLLAARPRREPDLRPHLHAGRSAHRLRGAGGVSGARPRPRPARRHCPAPSRPRRSVPRRPSRAGAASACRRSTGGAGATSRPTGAATGRSGSSSSCSWSRLFAEFIANDKPFLVSYEGSSTVPVLFVLSGDDLRRRFRDRGRLSRPAISSG